MKRCQGLYIIIISLLIPFAGEGQTVEQLIDFADLKYEQGQYQLAAMEYQRALFFGSKENIGQLYLATADCYFQLEEYDRAGRNYQFAASIAKTADEKAGIQLKETSCLLMEKKFNLALLKLYNFPSNLADSILRKQHILFGIAYYGLADFENSAQHFAKSCVEEEQKLRIEQYFTSKKLIRPYPKLAYYMSVVIPGSGQLYAGDIKNGMNSFILSIGLAVLTYNIAVSKSILDALMTVFPWWQRYHIGGYNAAERIAHKKREENRAEVFELIFQTVME
jgi:hypothetical protein